MLILASWLRDFVSFDVPIDQLSNDLTMVGLEVEGKEPAYQDLDNVVVSKLLDVKPVEGEERLFLCNVDAGERELQIVCGAPNLKAGMYVPLALDGAVLLDGTQVKTGNVHGILSQGMLCSELELGIGDNRVGVMSLSSKDSSIKTGVPLKDFLGLEDWILEIGVTPNRPDCLSILGIAREISAIYRLPIKDDLYMALMGLVMPGRGKASSETKKDSDHNNGSAQEIPVNIKIEDVDHCFRYIGMVFEGISLGPSPYWMQRRLASSGMRPINNVVDITNYVLLERGQPMHAFDLDLLADKTVIVRKAKKGETIKTLDGKDRTLEAGMLVIADAEKPIAIAGVMGGADTEVTAGTKNILLESALFEPIQIRNTRRKLKLSTEASYRFERAVDPEGVLPATQRAMSLLIKEVEARPLGPPIDICLKRFKPTPITLSPEKANRILGTDLKRSEMLEFLTSVKMGMEKDSDTNENLDEPIRCYPPPFRSDIKEDVDLIEEIARLYGYNNIATTLPVAELVSNPASKVERLSNKVRQILTAQGMTEIVSYSFCSVKDIEALKFSSDDPRASYVPLLNPLSEDQSVLRTHLFSSLLLAASRNIPRRNLSLSLFEIGKVFVSYKPGALPKEELRLGGLLSGDRHPMSWGWPNIKSDLFDAKAVVEILMDRVCGEGWTTTLDIPQEPFWIPGISVGFKDPKGNLVGVLGQLAPSVLSDFDINDREIFSFDISLSALEPWIDRTPVFRQIPRYPSMERDVALVVDQSLPAMELVDFIKSRGVELLEQVLIFDVYQGKQVPKGKKSIGLRLTYRAKDHTLSDHETNSVHEPLVKSILKKFNAELRT